VEEVVYFKLCYQNKILVLIIAFLRPALLEEVISKVVIFPFLQRLPQDLLIRSFCSEFFPWLFCHEFAKLLNLAA
jgi:hypothetical protein